MLGGPTGGWVGSWTELSSIGSGCLSPCKHEGELEETRRGRRRRREGGEEEWEK